MNTALLPTKGNKSFMGCRIKSITYCRIYSRANCAMESEVGDQCYTVSTWWYSGSATPVPARPEDAIELGREEPASSGFAKALNLELKSYQRDLWKQMWEDMNKTCF